LDGLRGLAILLVLTSHLGLPVFDFGAPAGVTLFFVLSGYLITGVLTRQVDSGGVRFAEFFNRRARRLVPALILAVAAGAVIFYREDTWSFSWPALTYTSSFIMAADGGRALGYLSHTWSLAVEEHFYLLWPVLISLTPARYRVKGVGLLAGVALVWRVMLWLTEPIYRVLFSTDGNAAALLIGCFIAVGASRLPAPNRRIGAYAVGSLLVVSVLPFVPIREPLTFLVIGLAAIAVHSAPAMPVLEVGWLRWFGVISYGLYLWHPILYGMSRSWLMAPLAVLVAWISWTIVEEPILNRGWLRMTRPALST
jgi:peptidoglycan/LPS O-acetylase OafA/YrhL